MKSVHEARAVSEEPSNLGFLKEPEVGAMTKLCRSQRYALEKDGQFPARIKLGRASVWLRHEIQEWMANAVAADRGQTQGNRPGVEQ